MRSNHPILFLSEKEKRQIIQTIREAEKKTSGEIRVHLGGPSADPFRQAREIFEKVGMTDTAARNGVLIFLSVSSKQFVILGDSGIHEKVGKGFWDEVVEKMLPPFKENRFAEGIRTAVETIGEKLRVYFPYQREDINELPDEISYSF